MDILKLLNDFQKEYDFAYKRVGLLDSLTQDLLHSLELDKLSQSEKNKLATKLKQVRQDRRYYKDIVLAYEPLVNLNKDNRIVYKTAAALGKTLKSISGFSSRKYTPRIKDVTYNNVVNNNSTNEANII